MSDDLSIAVDAVIEIKRLRAEIERLRAQIALMVLEAKP